MKADEKVHGHSGERLTGKRKSIERAFGADHRLLPDRLQSRKDPDKLSISFQRFEESPDVVVEGRAAAGPTAPRKPKAAGIVSSSHLVSAKSVELSELEFGLIVAWNAFSRWAVRCMSAAGCPDLTITDVLVLHHICHRARNKKVGDICFVLNVEDTHVVGYSLKKLLAAGLAQGDSVGKEVFYSPTPAGETAVAKYREVREACLIANLDAERNADIGESARLLRTMSASTTRPRARRRRCSMAGRRSASSCSTRAFRARRATSAIRRRSRSRSATASSRGASPRRVVRRARPRRCSRRSSTRRARSSAKASPRSTTSCGFLALFQREMQAALAVPVWTSSLLLVAELEAGWRDGRRVGVVTADAASLTADASARGRRAPPTRRSKGWRSTRAFRATAARGPRRARRRRGERGDGRRGARLVAPPSRGRRDRPRMHQHAAVRRRRARRDRPAGARHHDPDRGALRRLATPIGARHEPVDRAPLAVLDRPRRHLHRRRRQAARRHAGRRTSCCPRTPSSTATPRSPASATCSACGAGEPITPDAGRVR